MILAEISQKYLDAISGELRSAPAIGYRFERINKALGQEHIAEIDPESIANYVQSLKRMGLCNGSINLEIATLSALYSYSQKRWGWDIKNPCKGQFLKADSARIRFLNQDEFRRICDTPTRSPHLKAFISLALNTGMRKNEMLYLRWRKVDLHGNRIILEPGDTKTGKQRMIPINQNAKQTLTQLNEFRMRNAPQSPWVFTKKDGDRLTKIDIQFRNHIKKAGIHDFRVHDLRHTFASWLVMADVPLLQVKELLGHTTIKTTERYAHLAQSALIRAVTVLDTLQPNL